MTEFRYKILGRNSLKDLKPQSYLIPRILPEQGLVTLVAKPSSKKSFLALHMAFCVATGTPFLISQQLKVISFILLQRANPVLIKGYLHGK